MSASTLSRSEAAAEALLLFKAAGLWIVDAGAPGLPAAALRCADTEVPGLAAAALRGAAGVVFLLRAAVWTAWPA